MKKYLVKLVFIQLIILIIAIPHVYYSFPRDDYSNAKNTTIVVESVTVYKKPFRMFVISDSGEKYRCPHTGYGDIEVNDKIDILYVEGIDFNDDKTIIEIKKGSTVYMSKDELISDQKRTALARLILCFVVEGVFIFFAFVYIRVLYDKYYYKDRKINKVLILDVMTERISFLKKEINDIDEEFKDELTKDLRKAKLSKNKTPLVEQQGRCIVILYGKDSYDIISKKPIKFIYDDKLILKRHLIAEKEEFFDQMVKNINNKYFI
ncbi:MAG: hypothetical protein E7385_04040 [Ruminococcaceae bacterium]|nr:hypothetical protein [Oscillospiraceae bacterium]